MELDALKILAASRDLAALLLLAAVLLKGIPALVSALDRNTRILFRIEGKLGITDTDRISEQKQ